MKRSIIAGVLAITSALSMSCAVAGATVSNGFGCPKQNTVYRAYTAKHTKQVEICKLPGSKYRYTFGPRTPEIQVVQPGRYVSFYGGMGGGVEFKNGNYTYAISESKYGEASLDVLQGDKVIATIELDTGYGESINNTFEMLNP